MIEQPEQKQNKWSQDSILIKLSVITVIILLLLIPAAWIQGLISDREGYQQQETARVADKWSGKQLIEGPVLVLPYRKLVTETNAENKAVTHMVPKMLYVLPQALQIKADVKTELFQSGIYDAVVYNSNVSLKGTFGKPDLGELGIDQADVLYDKARLIFSISDLKGLKNNPAVKIQGQDYSPEPAAGDHIPFENGLQVNFSLQKDQEFTFSYSLDLKGSNELNFLDIGKTTEVEVNSDWGHPDFNGRYLPDSRSITDKGFGAKWHMLYYNRPFPQQWTDMDSVLTSKKV